MNDVQNDIIERWNLWSDLKHLENMWAWAWLMPMYEPSCIENFSFRSLSFCCQLVSLSCDCLHFGSSLSLRSSHFSSSCFMRTVSVASDLFDFSLHFISFLNISLITLTFLLPDTFTFLSVVDKYPAYFRWGPSHPGREWLLYKLWAQRPLHYGGLCRRHPGVLKRAAVPWWLRLRWRHHRSDAHACRRRADHSEEEGLSSSLSSSVSHDRTGKPVACRFRSSAVEFWNPSVSARIQRKSCGWKSSWTQRLTRQFTSWTIFRSHTQEKWGFG